ncbi:MAG: peptidoglycan DD-metalloendopeptidase family protein [Chitinophagaceae bacterium]|nr:peptidoglycan DD-metalloendopeptidase family protein [Chitinophagaceae bacterium]
MNTQVNVLSERIIAHAHTFRRVVDFDPLKEKLVHLDLTEHNAELGNIDLADTSLFESFIKKNLKAAKAKFGIGGYEEDRVLYKRSKLFSAFPSPVFSGSSVEIIEQVENRTIHLGIDIWGDEGTKIYAPLGGMVHSFAYNNNFGDYGATLILMHQLDTVTFYTLYGHLSLEDIARVTEFQYIVRGQVIGHFGSPEENGNWPPHLHFQVIKDMRTNKGDYPGVCTIADRKKYLSNCPDPDLVLNMMQYAQ